MTKILVVDDEEPIRQLLVRILTMEGYEVVEAVDGSSGYKKALEENPDVILSDVMMPVMDGFQLLQKLKEDQRTHPIPVIMLTGCLEPRNEHRGMRYGALDFITKPWGPGEVSDRVHIALTYAESHRKPG